MTDRIVAPFGTWPSRVTVEMVAGGTAGLSDLQTDGADLYWLESRPAEAGRSVLVRRAADGTIADLTPTPFDVASRVHEYGGGAYTVRDGRVVFSQKADGSVWLIDGGTPRRVGGVPGCRYADFRLDRSGRFAVCVREDHRDVPGVGEARAAIVLLDLSGEDAGEGRVLVDGPDFLSSPRVSPDGRWLAWVAWDHPDMPWDATRLHLARLGGGVLGEARLVAGDERESLVQPEWSPGGVLHVCSDRSGWWNVYRAGAGELEPVCPMAAEVGLPQWRFNQRSYRFGPDGTIVAARVSGGRVEAVRLAAGGPEPLGLGPVADAPAVLADGSMALLAAPAERPPAVTLIARDSGPVSVRTAGADVLAPEEVSVARPFAFPTEDGQTGHAWHYPPASATHGGPPGAAPPLIVVSHGGPTGMSTAPFSPRVQWWTSRGYAVLDVNYGGSTGFGRSYRQRLDGQWGVVDVSDCVTAARHLAAAGLADPGRMAIRGGSAGGFTTLAALAFADAFRAGASHYGVADLRLLAADTHKFESRYLDRLVGPLPEAEALYRERSPLFHADRISCPVIFFQGLDDKVVPPEQARAMVEAMRARGLEAPLHEFAGEAHGFRRADTIRTVLEAETAFFARTLGLAGDGH